MDPPAWVRKEQQRRKSSAVSAVSSSSEEAMGTVSALRYSDAHSSPRSSATSSYGDPTGSGSGPRRNSSWLSSSLSRRNSNVWLASMSMDVTQMVTSRGATPMGSYGASFSIPTMLEIQRTTPRSKFESLPFELITLILQYIAIDENGPANLYRVLSTCGRIYDVGIATLYRHVIFRYPHTFDRFRWSIEMTGYGQHVRVLDFSAFTSVGLGRTSRMNMEIQMVSHVTIFRALELCPGIYEFLGGEAIDIDMSPNLIDKLVTMPVLNTIDFCGANDPAFIYALENSMLMLPHFALYNLTKLSLHCCTTLPSHVLASIMKKLVSITRLDLTHTLITDDGLLGLPDSAKLTHLSLSRCTKLTSHGILQFIAQHEATKNLKWLSLMYEASMPCPLNGNDVETLIANLPKSITHLNLSGLPIGEKQLYMLNYDHIQSLSIAHSDLSLSTLREFIPRCSRLRFIDLTGVSAVTKWTIMAVDFLNLNMGIEMFEVSQEILNDLVGVKLPGFIVNPGRGRRGWIHRDKQIRELERDPSVHAPVPFSFTNIAKERMERGSRQVVTSQAGSNRAPPPASDPVWRFASHKVNVSEIGIGGVPTPAIYGHEGLYNYYSLNSV